jgi:hypothetical protein
MVIIYIYIIHTYNNRIVNRRLIGLRHCGYDCPVAFARCSLYNNNNNYGECIYYIDIELNSLLNSCK